MRDEYKAPSWVFRATSEKEESWVSLEDPRIKIRFTAKTSRDVKILSHDPVDAREVAATLLGVEPGDLVLING